jgi:hydroxylamine reductase (hybrid-cluster protein)
VGIAQRFKACASPTVTGLQELVTYGLKGVCAYLHHAEVLGKSDTQVRLLSSHYYTTTHYYTLLQLTVQQSTTLRLLSSHYYTTTHYYS